MIHGSYEKRYWIFIRSEQMLLHKGFGQAQKRRLRSLRETKPTSPLARLFSFTHLDYLCGGSVSRLVDANGLTAQRTRTITQSNARKKAFQSDKNMTLSYKTNQFLNIYITSVCDNKNSLLRRGAKTSPSCQPMDIIWFPKNLSNLTSRYSLIQ